MRGAQAASWGQRRSEGRGSLNESHRQQVPTGPGQAWGQALFSFLTPRVQGSQDNTASVNTGLCSRTAARSYVKVCRSPALASAPHAA